MLTEKKLKELRSIAQNSVEDMPDGDFKLKAFEVILTHLLASESHIPETKANKGAIKKEETISRKGKDKKTTKQLESSERNTLPEHILSLREAKFFSQPRTSDEVHKELQPTYACEDNRVAMALLRLANKKQLRKATKVINDREYKAYAW